MDDDNADYPEINFHVADIPKQCALCHAYFTERGNTGTWNCSEHSGDIVGGRFTCCNTPTIYETVREFYKHNNDKSINGCVKCDHKTHFMPFRSCNGKCKVPRKYAPTLGSSQKDLEIRVNSRREQQFYVYRFDKAKHERLRQRMQLHFLAKAGMANEKHKLKRSLVLIN